jgi:hypothetical protein
MGAVHGRASQGGFLHALEAFVTKGAFLAGIRTQALQIPKCNACVQPLLVGQRYFAACCVIPSACLTALTTASG